MISEIIINIINDLNLVGIQNEESCFAINILKNIIDNPIKISKDNLENNEILGSIYNETIIERARNDIEKWHKICPRY